MHTFRTLLTVAALSGPALAWLAPRADAQISLPPGGSVVFANGLGTVLIPGLTAGSPGLAGTVLASQTLHFTSPASSALTGTLTAQVVRAADTGLLDFYYQIANTSVSNAPRPSQPEFEFLGLTGFGGFSTAVQYRTDLGGTALGGEAHGVPGVVTRTGDGSEIDVNYAGTFTAAETSEAFLVRTDAVSFQSLGTAFIGGANPPQGVSLAGVYSPFSAPVPEGSSALPLGLGVAALLGASAVRLRRRAGQRSG